MNGSPVQKDALLLGGTILVMILLMYGDRLWLESPVNSAVTTLSEPKVIAESSSVRFDVVGIPQQLLVRVTYDFDETPLEVIVKRIRDETQIDLRFDIPALEEEGIDSNDPVTIDATDEPLYLFLNRFCRPLTLTWYEREGVITLTTDFKSETAFHTVNYNLAELMQDGYQPRELIDVIKGTTSGRWDVEYGGTIDTHGETMIVTQNDKVHFEVTNLLHKLRYLTRQTFVFEPPEHEFLREKLKQPVHVSFRDVPLTDAVAELSRQADVQIRIDIDGLEEEGISYDDPLKYELSSHALSTTLDLMLRPLALNYILSDNVILVTTEITTEETLNTAIYDVRDLCGSSTDERYLDRLIKNQTDFSRYEAQYGMSIYGSYWLPEDSGKIVFPIIGVMVVRESRSVHEQILDVLTRCRADE
ncbi:MAG: hypothetical protein O2955_06795 [Planctomycetota bacterium]|nr:hypothetical protein [Planctomycetota bacterium]MDA1212203.1 hypothetical protein [Planctomycetota bacterium]